MLGRRANKLSPTEVREAADEDAEKKRSLSLWGVRALIRLSPLDAWAPKRPLLGPSRRWPLSWTAGYAGCPFAVAGTLLSVVDHARFSPERGLVSVVFRLRGFAPFDPWAGLTVSRGLLDPLWAAACFAGLDMLHGPGHGTQHYPPMPGPASGPAWHVLWAHFRSLIPFLVPRHFLSSSEFAPFLGAKAGFSGAAMTRHFIRRDSRTLGCV
ncbi:hypothetical protein Nepgr_009321 [Nepenthes gracilis]|uniref:Uncharacterized protein n=1 Tax=Nepenthes gracilis TaxID=150966 RepID=A0AAD3SAM9_NEPGR|nr:hypothetical protein Nepgr_009321 [Nepenthes gracilis]